MKKSYTYRKSVEVLKEGEDNQTGAGARNASKRNLPPVPVIPRG
jgi:hypothetical protein